MKEIEGRFLKCVSSSHIRLSARHMIIDDVVIVEKDVTNRFVSAFTGETKDDFEQMAKARLIFERACKIAELMNNNRLAEAIFLANFLDWRDLEVARQSLAKAGFNPAEPRGYHGQWGEEIKSPQVNPTEIAYQGKYHDQVVDDIKNVLEAQGSIFLKGVSVDGPNDMSAVPDGLIKPKNSEPYFLEVKTGVDPKPTDRQDYVYPLICLGGHATSTDKRVAQLGLMPGAPFPPMDIWFAVQGSSADKTFYFNYCEAIGIRRKFHAP